MLPPGYTDLLETGLIWTNLIDLCIFNSYSKRFIARNSGVILEMKKVSDLANPAPRRFCTRHHAEKIFQKFCNMMDN